MRITKNTVFAIIIVYTLAFLFIQDWPAETVATGRLGTILLGKILADGLFVIAAGVLAMGPGFLQVDGADQEEALLTSKDVSGWDKTLYGFFLLNVIVNFLYHGYNVVSTTGAETSFHILYVLADLVVGVLFVALWSAACKAAARARTKADARRGDFPRAA